MNRSLRAFTLVEMLLVMMVIAILAGLILSGASYAQNKAARAKTETEIRSMEAALEGYKAENGTYPSGTTITSVYQALSGDGDDKLGGTTASDGVRDADKKSYMELKPDMLTVDGTKKPIAPFEIRDPFGNAYKYTVADPNKPASTHNPTYDLWSTAGKPNNEPSWITNW